MNRTFIEVPMFTKKWHELGLTDDDLRNLENVLLKNPKDGDAIQGTGGLRKIRIPMENKGKGKRGGARVIYVDIEIKEIIYQMNEEYKENNRGIEIIKIEDSYQLSTKKEYYEYVYKIIDKRNKPKLSNAALETLSIIAYNPRISRAEIEGIRRSKC